MISTNEKTKDDSLRSAIIVGRGQLQLWYLSLSRYLSKPGARSTTESLRKARCFLLANNVMQASVKISDTNTSPAAVRLTLELAHKLPAFCLPSRRPGTSHSARFLLPPLTPLKQR